MFGNQVKTLRNKYLRLVNNRAVGVGTEFLLGGIAVVGMAAIGKTIYDNWGSENKNDKRSKKSTSQNDECSLQ